MCPEFFLGSREWRGSAEGWKPRLSLYQIGTVGSGMGESSFVLFCSFRVVIRRVLLFSSNAFSSFQMRSLLFGDCMSSCVVTVAHTGGLVRRSTVRDVVYVPTSVHSCKQDGSWKMCRAYFRVLRMCTCSLRVVSTCVRVLCVVRIFVFPLCYCFATVLL